jgi:colanic acid/amylovoran biosynthesis glycosyltransferase
MNEVERSMGAGRRLDIAYLVDTYPARSETFIREEVRAHLVGGNRVTVYAANRGEGCVAGDETVRYATHRSPRSAVRRVRALSTARRTRKRFRQSHRKPPAYRLLLRTGTGGYEIAHMAACFDPLTEHDVLHCHFGPAGLQGLEMIRLGLGSNRLIVTFHAFDIVKYPLTHGSDVYEELFARADRVLTISRYMRDRLTALACPEKKLFVHHAGVDLDRFQYSAPRVDFDGSIRLLFVGRLVPKKGLGFGLEALARLVDDVSWNLRVVGTGELEDDLRTRARTLGIEDRIEFLGGLGSDEVAREMSRADLLLAPSLTDESGNEEGIPVVLMEAMASGLPVVSTRHSGIPELIDDGTSGFLADEGSSESLCSTLHRALDERARWPALAERARSAVEREFNIDRLTGDLEQHYREVMDGAPERPALT